MSPVEDAPDAPPFKLHRRFDRIGRLIGDEGMARLAAARVVVIGLGGVGSHCAESLVRSGVGSVDLVDFDLVCVTNTNRQLQAMRGTVGQPKATVLAERLRAINPAATIRAVPLFYEDRVADAILKPPIRYVVDAIDNLTAKCHLLATCRARGIPVLSCTGSSGRLDPTRVRVDDLAQTRIDPLAAAARKILRNKYDFPRTGDFGIPAVYSVEPLQSPLPLAYDGEDGFSCVCPNGDNDHHTCDDRHIVWGTAGFVTATVGLTAASVVVRHISGRDALPG